MCNTEFLLYLTYVNSYTIDCSDTLRRLHYDYTIDYSDTPSRLDYDNSGYIAELTINISET